MYFSRGRMPLQPLAPATEHTLSPPQFAAASPSGLGTLLLSLLARRRDRLPRDLRRVRCRRTGARERRSAVRRTRRALRRHRAEPEATCTRGCSWRSTRCCRRASSRTAPCGRDSSGAVRLIEVQGAFQNGRYTLCRTSERAGAEESGRRPARHHAQQARPTASTGGTRRWTSRSAPFGRPTSRRSSRGSSPSAEGKSASARCAPSWRRRLRERRPRSGSAFSLDSIVPTRLADGSTAMTLGVAMRSDRLRQRYPAFGALLPQVRRSGALPRRRHRPRGHALLRGDGSGSAADDPTAHDCAAARAARRAGDADARYARAARGLQDDRQALRRGLSRARARSSCTCGRARRRTGG